MTRHIAIFSEADTINKILRGEKTIEGRFTRDRIAPYGEIKKGDTVLLKQSGGSILGEVRVDNVLFFDQLSGELLGKLRREYHHELCVDDAFWKAHATARYGALIFLKDPKRFVAPLAITKRDRRAWIILP